MQLSDWLDQQKIDRSDFARRIGVSPAAITGWCKGAFWLSRESAQRIFDETRGAVTPNDFLQNSSQAAE